MKFTITNILGTLLVVISSIGSAQHITNTQGKTATTTGALPAKSSPSSPKSTAYVGKTKIIDMRSHPDTSTYFISFAGFPPGPGSRFGHAFVVWGVEDGTTHQSSAEAFGLYPADAIRPPDQMPSAAQRAVEMVLGQIPATVIEEYQLASLAGTIPAPDMVTDYVTLIVDASTFNLTHPAFYPKDQEWDWINTQTGDFSSYNMYVEHPQAWDDGTYRLVINDCVTYISKIGSELSIDIPSRPVQSGSFLPVDVIRAFVDTAVHEGTRVLPNETWTGEMVGNTPNGSGKWTFKNAGSYSGIVHGGLPNGAGSMIFSDGSNAKGTFSGGNIVDGTVTLRNRDNFVGTFSTNGRYLKGQFTWLTQNGMFFKGDFDASGNPSNGHLTFPSGKVVPVSNGKYDGGSVPSVGYSPPVTVQTTIDTGSTPQGTITPTE